MMIRDSSSENTCPLQPIRCDRMHIGLCMLCPREKVNSKKETAKETYWLTILHSLLVDIHWISRNKFGLHDLSTVLPCLCKTPENWNQNQLKSNSQLNSNNKWTSSSTHKTKHNPSKQVLYCLRKVLSFHWTVNQ